MHRLPKILDYLGVIHGEESTPEQQATTQELWRRIRDLMVHGPDQFSPQKSPIDPGQKWYYSPLPTTVVMHLDKGLEKTVAKNYPIQAAACGSFDAMEYLSFDEDAVSGGKTNYMESLLERLKKNHDGRLRMGPIVRMHHAQIVQDRIPLPAWLTESVSGGFHPGEFGVYKGNPSSVPKEQLWGRRSYVFDIEADVFSNADRPVCLWDSFSRFNLTRFPKSVHLKPMVHYLFNYTYNPDDTLTKLYVKEREKYDHKKSVQRVVKRSKHDRKMMARQLEFIGAGYEAHKKAEAAEKVKANDPRPFKEEPRMRIEGNPAQ